MTLFHCALKSILNRKVSVGLLIFSIALSTMMLLGVQHINHAAKNSFANSVSQTDLIVGPKTGNIQLLLHSIFHIGQPLTTLSGHTYREIEAHHNVSWAVPIALGDSHRGYPVVGTTESFFKHYQYGNKQVLRFSDGSTFNNNNAVVLGADVADEFEYVIRDRIYLSHGMSQAQHALHVRPGEGI